MGREHAVLLFALTLAGCESAAEKEAPTALVPVVDPGATGPAKVVVPTEGAPIVEPPAPVEPAPVEAAPEPAPVEVTPTKVGATTPAPTRKGAPPSATIPAAPPPAPAKPAPAKPTGPRTLVSEKLYRVELDALAPCKASAPCEASLRVHALAGYKVNAEYPTKFVAKPSAGVTVSGTGTFTVAGKTPGTMTVAFRAAAPGTAAIAGTLKLSVCTDDVCEIAAVAVSFDVPVTAP